MRRRLYWLGNIAKTRIINDILATHQSSTPVVIFDYGCGDGGDWKRVLSDYPHFRLIGYEPNESSATHARKRLQGVPAEIFTSDEIKQLDFLADYIVSFSVFEHVVHRGQFLAHAKRLLAPAGVFYLNYDDGHFRNWLDLGQADTWLPTLRTFVRTLVSRPAAAMGSYSKYQRRVDASSADRLVFEAGFRIVRTDYHNLLDLKDLAKTIPENLREEYARWWLEAEEVLNTRFRVDLVRARYGDVVNLWQQMASRTLVLNHA